MAGNQQADEHAVGVPSEADLQELIRSVKSKEAELGIAAISITAEREAELDFSQPMFDAGLQILIPAPGTEANMMTGIILAIFNSSFGPIFGLVLLTAVVTGHLVWFFERRRPNGMLATTSYFPGIFEACWWAASTLATQGIRLFYELELEVRDGNLTQAKADEYIAKLSAELNSIISKLER